MTHTSAARNKLLNRVRRIRGQLEALKRALVEDRGFAELLQLGARGSLMGGVIEAHVRFHIVDSTQKPSSKKRSPRSSLLMC